MGKIKVVVPFGENLEREIEYRGGGGVFTPELDENFLLNKEHLQILDGILEGHAYAFGETGLGKTQVVYQLAALVGQDVREVNMSGETTPDHFVGHNTLLDGNVVYKRGILLDAMVNGYWLLVDELDYGSPNILSILNNVMQMGAYTIPETKEKIIAHPDFRLIGTANTNGTGDDTGFYAGTNPMNRALLDRFETIVKMEFPNKKTLKIIIKKKFPEIDVDTLNKVIQLTEDIRKGIEDNKLYMPFGIRSVLKFCKKLTTTDYNVWDCALLSFANTLTGANQKVLRGDVQRVFGNIGVAKDED